ncbi:MAG: hypothetical protein EB084_01290 [Proteobacteria bacterium]|nr:hypothetical protein [Pseudomonadota bacterium]
MEDSAISPSEATSLRISRLLCLLTLLLAIAAPASAAPADPSVGLEVLSPADKARIMPGERIDVRIKVSDPLQLVRHVFVRVAAPGNHILNAEQDASAPRGGQGDTWSKTIDLPVSAASGRYVLRVEAMGDGNTPLQWSTLSFEVGSAAFGLRLISPADGTVVSRNDTINATIQLEDPRRKARRVFITLEDPKTKQILNGDREADRKGNLWIRSIHVPATAAPGVYRIVVIVYGEGREVLATQTRPVNVSMAPVRLSDVVLDPSGGIRPGSIVKLQATLADPRGIVRRVAVTVLPPTGRALARSQSAKRSGDTFSYEISLDDDAPGGTYTVEVEALGQGDEVVASRRLSFPVRLR